MAPRGDHGGSVQQSQPWLGTAILAAALCFGLGVLFALFAWPDRSAPATLTAELAHLKMLGTALKLHAEEHHGKFPETIADIDWRQNQPGMNWAGLPAAVSRFHDPANGGLMKWSYFPGHTDADPPTAILAASPVTVGPNKDKRIVLRLNGTAEVMDEATFQFETKVQASTR